MPKTSHAETQTHDETSSGLWNPDPGGASDAPRAVLRVLYHLDLARIGATTELPARGALQIGRNQPVFDAVPETSLDRPLDDPSVSRHQLRVAWDADRGVFEATPNPSAKWTLVALAPGERTPREIRSPTPLVPGSAIGIGDRVLLGLDVSQRRLDRADRMSLVGESDAIWEVRKGVRELARLRRPVLVLGETGTGKELVAHSLHRASARADGPMVVVNCAALPSELIESELFGHRKGAFTGAKSDRTGVFQRAHGGTLFLDELGELPLDLQPRLLRVLQDGLVTPVGSSRATRVDVRVVAATNRDPAAAIASGQLRDDLYHRVAGHEIRLPSLAARRFDIPLLFVTFLRRLRQDYPDIAWVFDGGRAWRKTIPVRFVIDLMAAAWPGNVRELLNVAERALRRNLDGAPWRAPELTLPDTTDDTRRELAVIEGQPAPRAAFDDESVTAAGEVLQLAPRTVTRIFEPGDLGRFDLSDAATVADEIIALGGERLAAVFARFEHKQSEVAAFLEVAPGTLRKAMKRLGIKRPGDYSLPEIEASLERHDDDLEAAARELAVSSQGLRRRLTLLRLADE